MNLEQASYEYLEGTRRISTKHDPQRLINPQDSSISPTIGVLGRCDTDPTLLTIP